MSKRTVLSDVSNNVQNHVQTVQEVLDNFKQEIMELLNGTVKDLVEKLFNSAPVPTTPAPFSPPPSSLSSEQ